MNKQGVKHLDLLVELRLNAGGKALLLLHLEVQAGRINLSFPERMFRYRIRLYERYPDHALLSCAIYLDRAHHQESEIFMSGGFGDELSFRYPVVNLESWRSRVAELEALAPSNPFAVVVLAQLACRATRPDSTRLVSKLSLARQLKKWHYPDETRKGLFLVIDSLLTLPDLLDQQFIQHLEDDEEPDMMQRLSSIDRYLLSKEKAAGVEEGRQEGRQEGREKGRLEGSAALLENQLQRKFGPLPEWVKARMAEAQADAIQMWALNVLDAQRLEDVFSA